MKPILKSIDSPDAFDLKCYTPDDSDYFGLSLSASFGVDDDEGADLFSLVVCTPRWLADTVRNEGGILMGRHYLIVDKYDFRRIKRFIDDYASRCEGRTWTEVAEKLGRLGQWEFEDYNEHPGKSNGNP